MKPTALCLAIDKKNSIEFLLDFLYYLYNYYMVCALSFHTHHVTSYVTQCDVTMNHKNCDVILSHIPFYVERPKKKKKKSKVNINNNLAVLPSHDTTPLL